MESKINLNRSNENKILILGFYQICGGIYGAIRISILLSNFANYPIGKILILILGIALYSFSIYCGYLLVTNKFLKGLNLSLYNNVLQVIGFGVAGYHFKFVSGFFAGAILDLTNDVTLALGLDLSIMDLAFGSKSQLVFISINIIAIFVLGFIFKMRDKIELKIKGTTIYNHN